MPPSIHGSDCGKSAFRSHELIFLARGCKLIHRYKLNGVYDDIFTNSAMSTDRDRTGCPLQEAKRPERTKEFFDRSRFPFVDFHHCLAISMLYSNRHNIGSTNIRVMRHTNLVATRLRQIGSESGGFFPFFNFPDVFVSEIGRKRPIIIGVSYDY